MNNLMKTFLVGALLSVSAPLAFADTISVTSSGTNDVVFTPTTIKLPGDGSASVGGVINGLAFDGYAIYFDQDTLTLTPGGPLATPLLIASFGGTGLGSGYSFYVTSESPSYVASGGFQTLTVTGTGYFSSYGQNNAPATFILQSSYSNGQTAPASTSFNVNSATTAPTPEPSSLLLLGSGLVGTAGMLFRRRRSIVA